MRLADDPRWQQLNSRDRVCPCCGQRHGGLFALATGKPDIWTGDPADAQPNTAIWDSGHVLTEDFCIVDAQYFFVRGVAHLPIIGGDGEDFGLGVWSSLSKDNFKRYVADFGEPELTETGPWFGWFSNSLFGYPETLNLQCAVTPRAGGTRPAIVVTDDDHPLAREQREGISLDRILELYAANGHDLGLS